MNLSARVAKLEQYRKPLRRYVHHVGDPITVEEHREIDAANGPIVIVPHPCKTVQEWQARYGSPR